MTEKKATLIIIKNEANRKLCGCSNCKEYIASPSNWTVYRYCYNCGAKFDKLISAKTIREFKENN